MSKIKYNEWFINMRHKRSINIRKDIFVYRLFKTFKHVIFNEKFESMLIRPVFKVYELYYIQNRFKI